MKFHIPQPYIDEGLISVKKHPDFDYSIYFCDRPILRKDYCGIITNSKNVLIAYPPYQETSDSVRGDVWMSDPVDVYERIYGFDFLGFYAPNGEYLLTERREFNTIPALLVQEIFDNTYKEFCFDEDYTFLFKYTGNEDNTALILVGGTHKETGKPVSIDILREYSFLMHIPIPSHTKFDTLEDYIAFKNVNEIDEKNLVVFENGQRIII